MEALWKGGFSDLSVAHWPVFQYPTPAGRRPIDLAAGAQMSKQAMNRLLRELEELGYIERRDGVAKRTRAIHLTAKGERVIATMRAELLRVESDWSRAVGEGRYRAFRETLAELNAMTGQGTEDAKTNAATRADSSTRSTVSTA